MQQCAGACLFQIASADSFNRAAPFIRRIQQFLVAGLERLGYQTPLWRRPRVADLIEQEFQVRNH